MQDFSREDIDFILDRAEGFVDTARSGGGSQLRYKIVATLFYEPSTRTRMSFEAAVKILGGDVLNFGAVEMTSVAKGESLTDTVRIVEKYSDAIVLRHPQEGAARLASEIVDVPVINAGDGTGQHPTQTLQDLFTIRREGSLDGKTIAMVGDLRYGRTVHSLAYALALYDVNLHFVSPKTLGLPDHILRHLSDIGVNVGVHYALDEVIGDVDVLYVTRIQRERFPDPQEYRAVAGTYRIDLTALEGARKELIVMHPLPRLDEIAPEIDDSPHARYFEQSFYGVPVRMAILNELLGDG
jgi:aspartate carbamoyltransferase catalytic subunit